MTIINHNYRKNPTMRARYTENINQHERSVMKQFNDAQYIVHDLFIDIQP